MPVCVMVPQQLLLMIAAYNLCSFVCCKSILYLMTVNYCHQCRNAEAGVKLCFVQCQKGMLAPLPLSPVISAVAASSSCAASGPGTVLLV